MPSADQNNLCSITNNSGKDIVVALALTDDESVTSISTANAARNLEVLKTDSGDAVIRNGNTGTVTLDRTDTATGSRVAGYELLVCDAFWLAPLACLSVSKPTGSTSPFAAQTVAADTLVPLSQATTFYQTIHTFPESQLTNDYMAALKNAKAAAKQAATTQPDNNQAALQAIEKAINGFFSTTKEYRQVTLSCLAAVDGYYKNFPAVWAQYKNSITYYLYSENSDAEQFAGTLLLESDGATDITANNGGYTCRFTPAADAAEPLKLEVDHAKAVILTYDDGLFTDDAGAATPAIALQGSFYLKRYFDGNIDDTKVVVIITGQVNGAACLGYNQPWLGSKPKRTTSLPLQTGAGQDNTGGKKDDNIMDDWRGIAIVIGGFAAGILLITATGFAIVKLVRNMKYKRLKEILVDWDKMDNERKVELAKKFRKVGANINDDLGYDFVRQQAERTMLIMQRGRLGAGLVCQRQALAEMLKYVGKSDQHLPGEINLLAEKVLKSQDRIWDKDNTDNLKDILPEELPNFLKMQGNLKTIRQRLYDTNPGFRPQNTDILFLQGTELYNQVEKALKEEEKEVKELDPIETETIIE